MQKSEKNTLNYYFSLNYLMAEKFLVSLNEEPAVIQEKFLKDNTQAILEFLKIEDVNPIAVYLSHALINLFAGSKGDNAGPSDAKIFSDQLKLIFITLGLDYSPTEYSLEEFSKKIQNYPNSFDIKRFLYTLRINFLNKESRPYLPYLFELLKKNEWVQKDEFSFEEILIFVMILFTIWAEFDFLPYEDQRDLLEHYFYRSIIVGAPVRQILSQTLHESADYEKYVLQNVLFVAAFEKNIESIEVEGRKRSFAEIASGFVSQNDADLLNEKALDSFLQSGAIKSGLVTQSFLREALSIVVHVKRGKLVDKIQSEEKTESQSYQIQLQRLILWFFNQKLWPAIPVYFAKKENKVKLSAFLYQLTHHDTLDTEESLQRHLNFTQFLRQNKLLKDDQEIIEFHEDDGKFHWSEFIQSI